MRNCYIVKFLGNSLTKTSGKGVEVSSPESVLATGERPEMSLCSRDGFGLDIDDEPPIVTQL